MAVEESRGRVIRWHADEGWGVIRSPDAPEDIWAHVSVVRMPGLRVLAAGQGVTVAWERVAQDGFALRATSVRPDGVAASVDGPRTSGTGMRSRLTLTFPDAVVPADPASDADPDSAGAGRP